jgi:hypothetical protein
VRASLDPAYTIFFLTGHVSGTLQTHMEIR